MDTDLQCGNHTWFIQMYPDVFDSSDQNVGGTVVCRGHFGVDIDALIASGQWEEVPSCLNELCVLQNKYEEQEQFFIAAAMGWANRKMLIDRLRLRRTNASPGVRGIRNQFILHILSYCINSWNKWPIIQIGMNDSSPLIRRVTDRLLTPADREVCSESLLSRLIEWQLLPLEIVVTKSIDHITDIIPRKARTY